MAPSFGIPAVRRPLGAFLAVAQGAEGGPRLIRLVMGEQAVLLVERQRGWRVKGRLLVRGLAKAENGRVGDPVALDLLVGGGCGGDFDLLLDLLLDLQGALSYALS